MPRSFYIHLAVFGALFVLPHLAHAAGGDFFGPIIPDACNCDPQAGTSITANGVTVTSSAPAWGCVLQVLQNIMNAFVSLGLIAITLFIAYAGFLLIMNPTSEEKRTQARQRILNAIIGLLIVLSAWVVVNSLMKLLYNPAAFSNGGAMPWQSILTGRKELDCLAPRNPGKLPNIGILGGDSQASNANGGSSTPSITVVNTNTPVTGTPTYTAAQSRTRAANANRYLSQICSAASSYGISSQGNILAGILGVESNGDPNAVSPAGAIGLMQLEPDTAAANGVTACKGSSRSNPSAACVAALKDPQTNINAGVKYLSTLYRQTGGNINNTIASYNSGIGNSRPSTSCPGMTVWACPANPRLQETRNYVPNVETVAQQTGTCS